MSSTGGAPRAVFFDVDFTLIHPGPAFQGGGYQQFCAAHGIQVRPELFAQAVAAASRMLDSTGGLYDPRIFIDYTRRIIEGMGGAGERIDQAARHIYEEWAACHHFTLYEDVPEVLRELHRHGVTIGLISNTQRCLTSFQSHFALEGLVSVAVSSASHGFMKPHPSIFQEALTRAGTGASDAVMVGDSLQHDVAGARRLGMRAVLVARAGGAHADAARCPQDVPVITSLRELPPLVL